MELCDEVGHWGRAVLLPSLFSSPLASSLNCAGSYMRRDTQFTVSFTPCHTLVPVSVHPVPISGPLDCSGKCHSLGPPGADPEMELSMYEVSGDPFGDHHLCRCRGVSKVGYKEKVGLQESLSGGLS